MEQQLLRWLTGDLLEGSLLNEAITALQEQVRKRISELQAQACKLAVNVPELRRELAQKQQEAWNLTDCLIASGRQSLPTVQARLAAAEARIEEIKQLLARAIEPEPMAAPIFKDIQEHLLDRLRDAQSVLVGSPETGKQILRKHIRKVTLTPGEANGKRVLHVAVEFELGGNSGVLLTESVDAFMQQYGF